MKANTGSTGKYVCNRNKKGSMSKRALQKRNNQFKKMFMIMVAIVTVMIGISFNSMSAKADNAQHANEVKMYTNYCVKPGDNLWTISEKFVDFDHYDSTKEFAKEVQNLNDINNVYSLTSGTYIMIPYYGEADTF